MTSSVRALSIAATLLIASAAACADVETPKTEEPAPSHTESTTQAPTTVQRCTDPAEPLLTDSAVGLVRIEAPVDEVRERCTIAADTSLILEGDVQPAILVEVATDTVLAEIVDDRVWRIRVRSPAIRTADSVGVGTPARELLDEPGATVAWGEGDHFILNPAYCGLSFQLTGLPQRPEPWTTPEVAELPDTVRVNEVLVTGGCP